MIMIRHELKQNRISLAAWTAAVGFLLVICILIFPEMMEEYWQRIPLVNR